MQYSTEEAALICGLISAYFTGSTISEALRERYAQVYRRLNDGILCAEDLRDIQGVLEFLFPVFPNEREGQKTYRAAQLKTKALLRKTALCSKEI